MGKSFKRILVTLLILCLFLTAASEAAGADTPVAAPDVAVENKLEGIRISWADVAGASGYEVLRKGAGEETETVIATVTSTSYTDAEVLAGGKYYYEVRAVDAAGGSAVSMPTSITRSLYFGSYEQDNDFSNGKEPIEWLVTKVEDGKLLLVSKYALDSQVYHGEFTDVTWETCGIRAWLNEDFLSTAFSAEEQAKICGTELINGANFTYKTQGGNNTVDKIFLLSLSEVRSLFPTDAERLADATAYALAQGAVQHPDFGSSWYWTRTPGYTLDSAVYVCEEGSTYFSGNVVNRVSGAVRPAMWIEAENAAVETAPSSGLAAPAINAANVSSGVRVSWTAVSHAVRYAVYRRTGTEDFALAAFTTEYAKVRGSYPNADFGTSWYWARTPGYRGDYFTFVSGNGSTFVGGNTVDHGASAVRPAIWVSMDAAAAEPEAGPDAESPEPEAPAAHRETYTVVRGDCLWSIAQRFYGDGSKWTVIFDANQSVIKENNLIYVGQNLVIPTL